MAYRSRSHPTYGQVLEDGSLEQGSTVARYTEAKPLAMPISQYQSAKPNRLVWLSVPVFALVYAAATLTVGWVDAYVLGSADHAPGGPASDLRATAQILSVITPLATVSNALVFGLQISVMSRLRLVSVIGVEAVAAILTVVSNILLSVAFDTLPSWLASYLSLVGVTWAFVGPAIITLAAIRLIARRWMIQGRNATEHLAK